MIKVPKLKLGVIPNRRPLFSLETAIEYKEKIYEAIRPYDIEIVDIDDLVDMCCEQGLEIIQLPIAAVKKYRNFPVKERHKDPFDRLLISLCIAGDYVFLSSDSKVGQYKADGLKFIS